MKKLIITLLLITANSVYAQRVREVKKLTAEQARAAVESSTTYKYIEDAKAKGKDIMNDPIIKDKLVKVIEITLKDVVVLEAGASNKIAKMIDIAPKEMLTEITRLNSIVKDAKTTQKDKKSAKLALELMINSSHTTNSLIRNSIEGEAQLAQINKIITASDKISRLNYGTATTEFVKNYKKNLTEGKTLEEAAAKALDNGKTLKDILECV